MAFVQNSGVAMLSCSCVMVRHEIQNRRRPIVFDEGVTRLQHCAYGAGACSLSLYASLEQQGFFISVTATLAMQTLRFHGQGNSVTNAISELITFLQ